jgi:hypothetical protein
MKASKKTSIVGNYIPCGVVKTSGKEEFVKILKKQNGLLLE